MAQKKIKIYTGDTKIENLFEKGLHPKNQIRMVENFLKTVTCDIKVYTNSPFIAEAFNKFGKEKDYAIECYFEDKKVLPEVMFDKFSKAFEGLVFGEIKQEDHASLGADE